MPDDPVVNVAQAERLMIAAGPAPRADEGAVARHGQLRSDLANETTGV
jgi:hypothetical protein